MPQKALKRLGPAQEPIRSEIFGIARFERHGRSLGESHRAGRATQGQATFYPRLQSNSRSLRASCQALMSHSLDEPDRYPLQSHRTRSGVCAPSNNTKIFHEH